MVIILINVFRLIHGEGDNLPGLIVDFYNGVVVMQMHSVGMYRIRKEIAGILSELLGERIMQFMIKVNLQFLYVRDHSDK